jgi:hypothetical protein
MRYGKEVDEYQIEQQRKDSLVMERTTSSKFIPSIHGYCSLAVMMDFMPEGNMHDYIKGSRILSRRVNGAHGVQDKSGKLLNSVDRLKIGIHIATSVADLHGIDGTKKPSYFHNDCEWKIDECWTILTVTLLSDSLSLTKHSSLLYHQYAATNTSSKTGSSSSTTSTTPDQSTLTKTPKNNAQDTPTDWFIGKAVLSESTLWFFNCR